MAAGFVVRQRASKTAEKVGRWDAPIRKRDIEACRSLVTQGANVNEKLQGGKSPLYLAIASQSTEIVALLLGAGANPHAWDKRRQTLLFFAAARNNGAVCKLLISHGAKPNARDLSRSTPLHEAAGAASVEAIRALLDADADVGAKNAERETPLHEMVEADHRSGPLVDHRVVGLSLLVRGGGDLLAKNRVGQTVLQKAISAGMAHIIRPVLDQNPEILRSNFRVLLYTAAAGEDTEFVDYLLEAGCNLELLTLDRQFSALHYAAQNGVIKMCRHLVGLGIGPSFLPDSPPNKYRTPMQWAVMQGRDEIVRYFIDECGEDVAQRTLDGCSLVQLVGNHANVKAVLQSAKTTRAVTEAFSAMADPDDEIAKTPVRRPKTEPL